ncbi:MAG: LacI family DNA-binding transcriptional regulator [Chloroflexota bacterium]|nr:LacI family DNA-binding transcriptional regulator [Chloroflexota bacterium]
MAAAARVHPSTVSRVLNGRGATAMRPETRRRVVVAARRLGYRPSTVARGLRLQRTMTLGMLVPDITNPFFSSIIKGAEEAARDRGYDLILCNSEDMPEREATYLGVLRARQVDGLLIASSRMADATIAELRREGFPFVLLNRSSGVEDLAVVVDNRAAAEAVVAHLARLGHRRVAHIAGPRTTTTGAERSAGFLAGIRRHDLAQDEELLVEADAFSEDAGYRAAGALLRARERPTAIFGANDLIAIGALRAARDAELRVPADLSIVGFNDIPLANLLEPALTTVHVPQLEMGVQGARLLIDRLEGAPGGRTRVVLPTALVIRASSTAAGDPVTRTP